MGNGNRPEGRSPPRSPLQLPATASSAETGNPQPSQGEVPRQADFFPAPLPPERPEPREEEEKGALPLPFFFLCPD